VYFSSPVILEDFEILPIEAVKGQIFGGSERPSGDVGEGIRGQLGIENNRRKFIFAYINKKNLHFTNLK
jgi:hypothetical protein